MLSALRKDFVRHGSSMRNPAVWVMTVYRYGAWAAELPAPLRWVSSKVYGGLALGIELATGSSIHREVKIGDAFHLVHHFNIHIHPQTVIGDRVGIMHDVTIGTNMERPGAPVIGNDVFIGTGAKILGPVTIGDGARIGANTVVLSDVPPGAMAMGVPARVIRYSGRPERSVTDSAQGDPSR